MPYTGVNEFLQAFFGSSTCHVVFSNWVEGPRTRDLTELKAELDCYYSIGEYPPEVTSNFRELSLGVRVLVIDDVVELIPAERVRLALGPPTAIVQSSAGSQQWAYRLSSLVSVWAWPRVLQAVDAEIGYPLKTNARASNQLFRLPMGRNTKLEPGRDGFKVHLVEFNPDVEIDTAWLLGLSPGATTVESTFHPDQLTYEEAAELMDMVPNEDVDRTEYINVGHRLKARCPEGEAIWEEWAAKSSKNNTKGTGDKWDTFGSNATNGWLLDKAAKEAEPERYAGWYTKWWEKRRSKLAKEVFDDGEVVASPKLPRPLFRWIDHKLMPTRDWLYGRLLIRKFLTMTVAPGGAGKSSLIVTEALAQATGKNLIGERTKQPLRVWMWNLEDPYEEVQRRILAAAKHHGISEGEIGDRLLVSGDRGERLVIADMVGNRPVIMHKVVDELIRRIREYGVDILIIDPFVSCHKVPENDNIAQDMVMKELNRVAEEGNCAVHIVDHVRKAPSGTEIDAQSARGAKAKTDAARVVRVINRMTDAEGKNIYSKSEPWKFIHVFHDKSNMAPPRARREWFQLVNVSLENGGIQPGIGAAINPADEIGVIDEWSPPNAADMADNENFQKLAERMQAEGKQYRRDSRSPDWIGHTIRAIIDPEGKLSSKQIADVLEVYLGEKLLQSVPGTDASRKPREFIVLGKQF